MDNQELEEKVNFIVFYAEQRDITEDEVELINKRVERLKELIGYHEKEIIRISRALAKPQLNESVLPISDVIKSVCDDFMPKFGDSVHCLWCGHSRKKHREQTVL